MYIIELQFFSDQYLKEYTLSILDVTADLLSYVEMFDMIRYAQGMCWYTATGGEMGVGVPTWLELKNSPRQNDSVTS